MTALSFKKQFAFRVAAGLTPAEKNQMFFADFTPKRQTIRALRKDGRDPKRGDMLQLYTGMRTKSCQKIGEVKALFVLDIEICKRGSLSIEGNANSTMPFYKRQSEQYPKDHPKEGLAKADGFKDWAELLQWFKKMHGLPFKGKLIGW